MAHWLKDRNFGLCRALTGHHWAVQGALVAQNGLLRLPLRCALCKTGRTDYVGKDGGVEKRFYRYAKGYQIPTPKDGTRPTKREIRLEAIYLFRKEGKA